LLCHGNTGQHKNDKGQQQATPLENFNDAGIHHSLPVFAYFQNPFPACSSEGYLLNDAKQLFSIKDHMPD
jgi:hypothetical protein